MIRTNTSLLGMLLVVAGCGNGIDGDWRICENSACTAFDDDGLRLRSDETFVEIDLEDVCEKQGSRRNGTYFYQNRLLTVFPFSGDPVSAVVEIDGDRANVTFDGNRSLWAREELGELPPCSSSADGTSEPKRPTNGTTDSPGPAEDSAGPTEINPS